jgi:endonuclease/exonuclease/phosphatase family metal-dependent hydrolase
MRIVSYNILDGGEGRADPLAEVLEAQNADLIALVESADLSVVERIAKRFKMDYVQGVGRNKEKASTVLSRWRIKHSINHGGVRDDVGKSLLEVTLETPTGGELTAAVVHLTAGAYEADEDQRVREVEGIIEVMSSNAGVGRSHLLLGDFNSNSPTQRMDIAKCKEKTRKAYEANGHQIPRRVVQLLKDKGYVDLFEAHNPELAATATTFTTYEPGQRVDYIFGWGITDVRKAWVEKDRLATYASDHYPIGVELGGF